MRTLLRLPALGLAMLLVFSATAYAQSMEERLEAKMKKDFITKAAWETDYEAAQKKAQAEGKIIVAYFTRSYSP